MKHTHLKADERGDLTVDSIAGAAGAAIVIPALIGLLVGLWGVSTLTNQVSQNHIELADIINEAAVSGQRFGSEEAPSIQRTDRIEAAIWETSADEGPAAANVGELSGTELDFTEQYWINATTAREIGTAECTPAHRSAEDCLVVSLPVTKTLGGFSVTEIDARLNAHATSASFSVDADPGEVRYTGWLSHRCDDAEIVVRSGSGTERRDLSAGDEAFIYGSVNFIGANGQRISAENATISIESSCGMRFEDLMMYEGPRR